MALKKIPPPRLELLFPPVMDSEEFRYFENCEAHPFRSEATDFELVNAWWLAETSLLAYSPREDAVPIFRRANLEVAGGKPVEHNGTQCYIVFDDRAVIVAFRGTQVLRPDNWNSIAQAWRNFLEATRDAGTDADFALTELGQASGRLVHRGFLKALDEVWPEVEERLIVLQQQKPTRTLWFTGHSLGGALATLAADRCQNIRGLYTYGCPMVGDNSFAKAFHAPSFRFVNNNDIVPRVPPVGPYALPHRRWVTYVHVGHLKYIDADGQLLDKPERWDRIKNRFRGYLRYTGNALPHLLGGRPLGVAPDDLNDHAPLLYAVHAWNIYASTLS